MFKITIITSVNKLNYLKEIEKYLLFNFINEWIIVYNGLKIKENPYLFKDNEKIKEYIYTNEEMTNNGCAQKNYGLNKISIEDTYIYFLNDNNIINPKLYNFLLDENPKYYIYTFNQERRNLGNKLIVGNINEGMYMVHYSIAKKFRFNPYISDDPNCHYLNECISKNPKEWVYINYSLCYYNYFEKFLLI